MGSRGRAPVGVWGTTDIRIRINPKILIRIPDHFCFKFWRWWRFALSQKSSDFDEIAYTAAHLELDDSQMTKYGNNQNSR